MYISIHSSSVPEELYIISEITISPASGKEAGVAESEIPVLHDVPLRAKTVKKYSVPLLNPVTVSEVPIPLKTTNSPVPKSVPDPKAASAV